MSGTDPTDTPRLLAGGNPQIPKGDGDASVQAYIDAMPGWKRCVGRRLDALVARAVPDVHKAVKWNSPLYGVGGQSWFLGLHCLTDYVKVAFFAGGALEPLPPVASKDPNTRYVHIREGESLDEALWVGWIQQAAALPGWVSSPTQQKRPKGPLDEAKSAQVGCAELQQAFDADPRFQEAFEALTPGRQRGYHLYFSGAKQSATRASRVAKSRAKILAGKGRHDR